MMNKLVFAFVFLLILVKNAFAADITPPELTSFDFSPKEINVSDGPATVTVSASATDDLSGVDYIQMRFSSPTNVWYYATFRPNSSGDFIPQEVTIPALAANGEYLVNYFTIRDNIGNIRSYSSLDLLSLGFPNTLQVTGWVDTDGDGIGNSVDNCTSTANADQRDANSNSIGDACDPADSDGDGISDEQEYAAGTDPARIGVFPPGFLFPEYITPLKQLPDESPLDGQRPLPQ